MMKLLMKYAMAASILFAVAIFALWIRSYYAYDTVYFTSPFVMAAIESNHGRIYFHSECNAPYYAGYPWDGGFSIAPSVDYKNDPPLYFEQFIGFEAGIAHWLIIAIICIAFAVRSIYLKTLLPIPGICPKCSYDMCATPDKCPECGYTRHVFDVQQ